jgi:hypothetical protein
VADPALPLTRRALVRFTTDRLREQGVVAGTEGVTSYRIGEGIWKVRVFGVSGDYVDARASDFEVVRGGTRPRGVVIRSLNGGWLTIAPVHSRSGQLPAIWDVVPRTFQPGDFAGMLTLSTTDDSYGFPVIWSREEQLKLVYCFELPDRMTHTFPQQLRLRMPDGQLEIEGEVTIDASRHARKAAELKITLRSPTHRTRPEFSGVLVVDAGTASIASDWLVDLFPSVTPDDIDPV